MGLFWGGGAVSSFSPSAGCGVGCCWATDCYLLLCPFLRCWQSSAACPAAGYPCGVTQTFPAPVACPAPAMEFCLLGLWCFWCGTWFSTLCGAFLPGPAVLGSFPCRRWPACGFCHRMPGLPLCRWLRLGCNPPLVFSLLLLHRLACGGSLGFFTLCLGALMVAATALWVTVWGCLMAPHSSRACFLLCHLLLQFSPSVGAVLCSLLGFPCLRVGALLACGVYSASSLWGLLSRLPLVVGPPSPVSVGPSPALAVGWFGHTSVTPLAATVCWALVGSLLHCSVALGSCAPYPVGSSRVDSHGFVVKLLVFSWPLYYGSFLSLPLVTDGSGVGVACASCRVPYPRLALCSWHALVLVAVPPSVRSALRVRTGFLFCGPGLRVGFPSFLLLCFPSGCGHPLGQ